MINKPKALRKGDRIGVVAPSSPVRNRELIGKVETTIEKMGFKPVMYPSCYEIHGFLSGTDKVRAEDINNAFEDKNIDGVLCLRGGYGTPRILALLDYNIIKANPKVFLGYSDITGLHMALNKICRMVTFHGPTGTSDCFFEDDKISYSKHILSRNVFETKPLGIVKNPEREEIVTVNGGQAEGEIIGGNLSLLVSTLGSQYEVDTKEKIFFIEEVGEYNYKIDRMLNSLALAGKFKDCAGVILGTWKGCTKEHEKYSLDLTTMFNEIIKPFGKPVINNFRAGHVNPQITIPFGTKVRLDANKKEVEFLESACV